MTSRRIRKLRRDTSLPALLAEARSNPEMVARRREAELAAAFVNGPVLCDEQISQLLTSGELWRDAAHWHPGLLDD